MFLHEPGEDSESFTRQDLSNLNAISTQQPTGIPASQSPQPQAPLQHAHPIAAASQDNDAAVSSPIDSPNEPPALPAHASWADQARRLSRTTTASASSPMVINTVPVVPEAESSKSGSKEQSDNESATKTKQTERKPRKPRYPYLEDLPRKAFNPDLVFHFNFPPSFSEKDRWVVENMPPLFDPNEGTRRRLIKEREAEELQRQAAEAQVELKETLPIEPDEIIDLTAGGSSQLGGEPEERPDRAFPQQASIQSQNIGGGNIAFGQTLGFGDDLSSLGSGRNSQQHTQQQQLLLQQLNKLGGQHGSSTQGGNHSRQPSRFFLNEALGTANKNMAKASGLLGHQYGNSAGQHQGLGAQYNYSSVQGPPPGLKTTGTPPATGGGMFGQGHAYTPGVGGYGGRENEKLWDLHRGRGAAGPDGGKRESMFPSYNQYPSNSTTPSQLGFPYAWA